MQPIRLSFASHGLGDVVHCCHAMRMYLDRGYDVAVQVEPNKRWVWEAAGIPIYEGADKLPIHPYYYPDMGKFFDVSTPDCLYSKIAHLFEVKELPTLGSKADVWRELCATRIDASDKISATAMQQAKDFLEGLPRPIIMLHSKGTNWQEEKSIPDATAFQLILELLSSTGGSVVTLDWDGRAPTLGHPNVRPIIPHWDWVSTEQFGALCQLCDLLIGVDSGPFHLAGWFDIPTLFVARKIPPVRCCLPSPNATYLVSAEHHEHWATRGPEWRFAEFHGPEATVKDITLTAMKILGITLPAEKQRAIIPELIPGLYTYRRVGHDERPMELLEGGKIGIGAAGRERSWSIEQTPVGPVLSIFGDHGEPACHLQQDDKGTFLGRWLTHERMPIELIPDPNRPKPVPEVVLWGDLEDVDVADTASITPAPNPPPLVRISDDSNQFVHIEGQNIWIRQGEHGQQDMDVVRDVMVQDSYRLDLRHHYGPNEVVIDIGAHIGTFATMWHRKNPQARIICIEACPENIPILTRNVGHFATVINAACTYDDGPLMLLNSVKAKGTATGGSMVVPRGHGATEPFGHLYWQDTRPLRKLTLEDVMQLGSVDHIDVLKLDCEGSEFSILEHSPAVDGIQFILGEYHGHQRFMDLLARRLPPQEWAFGHMHASNDLGIFHLENLRLKPFLEPGEIAIKSQPGKGAFAPLGSYEGSY